MLRNNPVLKEIGMCHSKSAAQVASRFLIRSGVVVIFDFELTADEMAKVEVLDGRESLFFSHHNPKIVEWFMTIV